MDCNARDAYLEAQVMTATPQKLRLMLIDGAIRLAREAVRCWEAAKNEEAFEAIQRCRGIVAELLASVKPDDSTLASRVAEVYAFLFQTLTEAQLRRDPEKLEGAVAVLEVERETWRQVCEQMPEAPNPALREQNKPREVTAAGMPAIPPPPGRPGPSTGAGSADAAADSSQQGEISLEA
jgi:flagellar protein FliS